MKTKCTQGKLEVLTPRHGYPIIRTEAGVGVFKTDLSISRGKWIKAPELAQANASELVLRWNCHEPLLTALRKCEDVIGMAQLRGQLTDNAFSPVSEAVVSARRALNLVRT